MKRTKIKELLIQVEPQTKVVAKGWVRTKRASKNVAFVAMNDGSCLANLQVVLNTEEFDEETIKRITTGASLAVHGILVESQGGGQRVDRW